MFIEYYLLVTLWLKLIYEENNAIYHSFIKKTINYEKIKKIIIFYPSYENGGATKNLQNLITFTYKIFT